MKYLVTGGAGFIGSNIVRHLVGEGHTVTALDNFSSGWMANLDGLEGRVKIIHHDLSKPFEFGDRYDVISHQAAITDPRHPDDEQTLHQNVHGFKKVLALAQRDDAKLVYASTAGLYGHASEPMIEDQPKDLHHAYAESKLIMDEMASHHLGDMHIVGLRYFNVFGPNEVGKGTPASMVYHLAKAMKNGRAPRLFEHGEHERDHIYVSDVVRANMLALDAPSGVYNVGTGVATSFNGVANILNGVLGTDFAIEYFPMSDAGIDPDTYQAYTCADTSRARNRLGFEAEFSTADGIADYIARLDQNNPEWFKV